MDTKFQIGDIIHDPLNHEYFLIEHIEPHKFGFYYCWRMIGHDTTGHYEATLIDKYGEFKKVG